MFLPPVKIYAAPTYIIHGIMTTPNILPEVRLPYACVYAWRWDFTYPYQLNIIGGLVNIMVSVN